MTYLMNENRDMIDIILKNYNNRIDYIFLININPKHLTPELLTILIDEKKTILDVHDNEIISFMEYIISKDASASASFIDNLRNVLNKNFLLLKNIEKEDEITRSVINITSLDTRGVKALGETSGTSGEAKGGAKGGALLAATPSNKSITLVSTDLIGSNPDDIFRIKEFNNFELNINNETVKGLRNIQTFYVVILAVYY